MSSSTASFRRRIPRSSRGVTTAFVSVLLSIGAPTRANGQQGSDGGAHTPLGARIDTLLTRASAFSFSGQVLVAKGGNVILHRAYGLADRARGVPMTLTTRLGTGSWAKVLTAAAIMSLEAEGRLRVTDSIARYLPGVPADKSAITIHQLLTHTSGLGGGFTDAFVADSLNEHVAQVLTSRLAGAPGSAWRYSSEGYSLLAAIAERASGQAYHEYVRRKLLVPAHMDNTTILGGSVAPGTRVAHAYVLWNDQGPISDWPLYSRAIGSGDGLSTAADIYAWHVAYTSGRLLGEPAFRRASTPHAAIQDGVGYGYGLFVWYKDGKATTIEHGGDDLFGYNVAYFYYPPIDAVMIIITNGRDYDGRSMRQSMQRRIEELLHGVDTTTAVPSARWLTAAQRTALVGSYALRDRAAFHVVDAGGPMFLAAEGQEALQALGLVGSGVGAAANTKARVLLEGLKNGRVRNAFAAAAGDSSEVEGLSQWWKGFVRQYGPLMHGDVLGTTMSGRNARTYVRLTSTVGSQKTRSQMIRLVFADSGRGPLAGVNPDRVADHPYVLSIAQAADGTIVGHDLFSGRTVRLTATSRTGAVESLRTNGVVARRDGTGMTRWTPLPSR